MERSKEEKTFLIWRMEDGLWLPSVWGKVNAGELMGKRDKINCCKNSRHGDSVFISLHHQPPAHKKKKADETTVNIYTSR